MKYVVLIGVGCWLEWLAPNAIFLATAPLSYIATQDVLNALWNRAMNAEAA